MKCISKADVINVVNKLCVLYSRLLFGNDEHIIEEKEVVASVAESSPYAELFTGNGQFTALLQPS